MYNPPASRTGWLHEVQLGPCTDLNHPMFFKGNQTVTLQDPEPISHRLRLKQNPLITFLVAFPAFVPARQSRNKVPRLRSGRWAGASPTEHQSLPFTCFSSLTHPWLHRLLLHTEDGVAAHVRHACQVRSPAQEAGPAVVQGSGSGVSRSGSNPSSMCKWHNLSIPLSVLVVVLRAQWDKLVYAEQPAWQPSRSMTLISSSDRKTETATYVLLLASPGQ